MISIIQSNNPQLGLVACRATVYRALVPGSRIVPDGTGDEKTKSFGRPNAGKFVEHRCEYPRDHKVIAEARRHIFEVHAKRLTRSYFEGDNLNIDPAQPQIQPHTRSPDSRYYRRTWSLGKAPDSVVK
jgi:hypothetical protein